MNSNRRKEIQAVLNELADLRSRVESLQGDEQDAFDNTPESLQQSDRGQVSEGALSALDDALTGFDDIETALNLASA